MPGVLNISIAFALIMAMAGFALLGLSVLEAFLLYSGGGTAATFFFAWRRYRCIAHHQIN
ncbi:MAG: hypothetical protein QM682_01575 [Paracoccus sp. (in: a-proteobacteria)]|uniref:hypothetical protein n=1 Tax=Paracoccus sp. TaxID=267 RepID=UPI0039E68BC3